MNNVTPKVKARVSSKASHHFMVLLVEDNPDDVYLTQLAFEESDWNITLSSVENGEDALRFLEQKVQTGAEQLPDLILLDLHLPGMSGKQLLVKLKNHERYRGIPVIILTTSAQDADVRDCFRSQAAGYIHKPVDLERFIAMTRIFEQYWFSVITLPGREISGI